MLSSLILLACGEDENPVGFDTGPRGAVGKPPETIVLEAPSADIALRAERTTGSSRSLLVGSDDIAFSRGFFRFASIPDTTGADRAKLRFHVRPGRGGALNVAMRRVLGAKDSWTADTITLDSVPDTARDALAEFPGVPTGSIAEGETDSVDFAVPMSLVLFWRAEPDSNAGIMLTPTSTGGMARIISRDDVLFGTTYRISTPALIFEDQAGSELSRALATEDAYVIQDRRPAPGGSDPVAVVTSGPPSRFLLRFDLAPVPLDASVARATLRLPFLGFHEAGEDSIPLISYAILDPWTEESVADTTRLGSAASGVVVAIDSLVTFEIGGLVQTWLESGTNEGIAIRMSDETSTLDGLDFPTRESASAAKPSLTITYVPMQDPRWQEEQP